MKKKLYEKPSMMVFKIQQHQILCGSPNTPPDAPEYGDWLG
jgi:hypothetical protein